MLIELGLFVGGNYFVNKFINRDFNKFKKEFDEIIERIPELKNNQDETINLVSYKSEIYGYTIKFMLPIGISSEILEKHLLSIKQALKLTSTHLKTDNHMYYYCKGKYDYKICDTTAKWHVKTLEKYIEESILERIEVLKNINYKEENVNKVEVNEIKIKILAIEEKIENLIRQLEEASTITSKYINERIEELDTKKQKLSNKLNEDLGSKINNRKIIDLINSFSSWDNLDFEDKKIIAQTLINKINLDENNLEIDWKQ